MIAVVIHPDGRELQVDLPDDPDSAETLRELQGFVGGYIEYVAVTPTVHLWVNEEAGIYNLPPNVEASRITRRHILGTVILIGRDNEGQDTDLPEDW